MNVQVIAFGIAKDILGTQNLEFRLDEGDSLADFRKKVTAAYPDFSKLVSLRFAVGEEYQPDDYILSPQAEIVIIPPVAGG